MENITIIILYKLFTRNKKNLKKLHFFIMLLILLNKKMISYK